jgi:hypothetical protein
MRKTSLLLLFVLFAASAFSQTADEVINKFIEASGGKDKLNAINTLQYNQLIVVKSPMGNIDIPIQYYKEKNKFYRMQANLNLAGQFMKFFTVVSDSAGYVLLPALPMLGTDGGLKKLNESERKLQAYQLDAAGYFAGLVDYAAKGSKVELLKDEKVNNEDNFKLKLTMNTGQSLTYFINKATGLVTRVDTQGDMAASMSGMGGMMGGAGGQMDKMAVSAFYSDYKDFNGVKFPLKVVMKTQMGESESTITNVRINEAIEPRLYKPE